jgi:hypothetical protein
LSGRRAPAKAAKEGDAAATARIGVAGHRIRAYVFPALQDRADAMVRPAMNPTIREHIVSSSRPAVRPAAIAGIVGAGLVLSATAALWAYYGTAVFYETVIAGIDACF